MHVKEIPLSELALAYEMRCSGLRWKWIAIGLGRDAEDLYQAVKHLRTYGFHDERVHVSEAQVIAAEVMRRNSRLSWKSIADYLGLSHRSIEMAVYRRRRDVRHDRKSTR